MGIIVGWNDADGVHAKTGSVFGQIDGRTSIRRADVHDNGHSPSDPVYDLLGDLLPLVNFHYHPLAMSAQGKKSMDSRRHVEVDDRVCPSIVDGAVILESQGHGHQYSLNFIGARPRDSFLKFKATNCPYPYRNNRDNSTLRLDRQSFSCQGEH